VGSSAQQRMALGKGSRPLAQGPGHTLAAVTDPVATTQIGSEVRAAVVLVGAVVVGGGSGFALAELLGVGEVRWANTQLRPVSPGAQT
jgi:hypothetical protein